jgi:uncharacterized protein YndB with AHSA1/START domain
MNNNQTVANQTVINKDVANKRILIEREFDAPVKQVWNAWTKPELLDQWWAPKPWKAETKSMDFREGGMWLYAMVGPDGTRQWCRDDYKKIVPEKTYSVIDSFCDENGNKSSDMPGMDWKNTFSASGNGTKVSVEIKFESEADMNKILEMGFEEGFTAAHGNLDELLAK